MRSRDGEAVSYINFVSLRVKVDAATTFNSISICSFINLEGRSEI